VAEPAYFNGALTVDESNLYWGEEGQTPAQAAVMQMPRSGGKPLMLASSPALALVSDGAHVYWGGVDGSIQSVPVGGGTVGIVAPSSGGFACIAADDDSIYWTGGSEVLKVPKAGGATLTIAGGGSQGGPSSTTAIAVDATSVYWVSGGSIMAVPASGGPAVTLFSGSGTIGGIGTTCRALAVTPDSIIFPYVASGDAGPVNSGVFSIPLRGASTPTTLSSAQGVWMVVADATDVYWAALSTTITIDQGSLAGGPSMLVAIPQAPVLLDMILAGDGTLYWTTDAQIQAFKSK
jgi:hypothetical protein